MRKFLLYLSVLWLGFTFKGFNQGTSPQASHAGAAADPAALLDEYVPEAMKLWKTPGLSIVIVKDGKEVYKKGFGVTRAGQAAPFTTTTLGVCASTTKAMTAVCMGMLIDEGKVKWTDKVRDVYPDFALFDPYVSVELTVRDLFTHNAGLGNADGLWVYGYSRDEIIRRMRLLKPAYAYHDSFIYQNLMYLVAGEVIHRLSGLTWEEFISKRLFNELGMSHTFPGYQYSVNEPSHETPHYLIHDTVRSITQINYPNVGPAGGVWSCSEDMEKWMLFLLDSAHTSVGKRLLTASTFRELFKPQTLVTPSQFYPTMQKTHPNWTTYGLGWFQEDYRGKMLDFHTGSLDGVVAICGLVRADHFGVYIFGNLDHSEIRHALMYKAIDQFCFNGSGKDWSGELFGLYQSLKDSSARTEKDKASKRVMNTRPSRPLSAYAGHYSNEIYGDAQVVFSGDSLAIKLPNDIALRLSHWNFDSFEGNYDYFWWDKASVKFSLDVDGRVVQFDLDGTVYSRKDK
jgi:CubicO group peptidase (beta-lactamase class C family)